MLSLPHILPQFTTAAGRRRQQRAAALAGWLLMRVIKNRASEKASERAAVRARARVGANSKRAPALYFAYRQVQRSHTLKFLRDQTPQKSTTVNVTFGRLF